jgi:hypothetical protein
MIDGDRALVAVGAEIEARFTTARLVEEGRAVLAGIVADLGPLNLDDLGTEVAEELSGEGSGENPAQVEHPHTGQRRAHDRPARGLRGIPSTRSLMMFF